MKKIVIYILLFVVLISVNIYAKQIANKVNKVEKIMVKKNKEAKIQVIKNGELSSYKGPSETFTGDVRVDSMLPRDHDSNVSLATVTFEPGARTAWHTHSWGQILVITSGVGQVQQWGGKIIEVRPGDVVWFPAGVKHWHGAKENNAMSHISIIANSDKGTADWMEKVSDEQYKNK